MSQSIKSDHISESTIARIAGNLLSGTGPNTYTRENDERAVRWAVMMARAIALEVQQTRGEAQSAPAASAAVGTNKPGKF